jgi:hypothetical protein
VFRHASATGRRNDWQAGTQAHLWNGTVVPDVPVVGEAVVHKPRLALLLVLDDGVEWQTLADLLSNRVAEAV